MFTPSQLLDTLVDASVSHVVWIPDSTTGAWEESLDSSDHVQLVRVCREGEAWPLAAGLYLGGSSPLVVMQVTGLFESGDALRNVLFDLGVPLPALIGARNWLTADSPDSARRFTVPLLEAWQVPCAWISRAEDLPVLAAQVERSRTAGCPTMTILAEGVG